MSDRRPSRPGAAALNELGCRLGPWAGVGSKTMRRLLVLFALLGLLYSPAAAAAAQRSCVEASAEMAGMMMGAAATADDAAPSAPDPCCDHGKKTMDGKACAQACATMCGGAALLPAAGAYIAHRAKASVVAERVLPLKPRPPPRTERPPRTIA